MIHLIVIKELSTVLMNDATYLMFIDNLSTQALEKVVNWHKLHVPILKKNYYSIDSFIKKGTFRLLRTCSKDDFDSSKIFI